MLGNLPFVLLSGKIHRQDASGQVDGLVTNAAGDFSRGAFFSLST